MQQKQSDFLPADGQKRIFAHRGLHIRANENSLSAFSAALAIGATHIETDVRATADAVAVLCHDKDLVRILGSAQKISELSYTELAESAKAKGYELTTLDQALAALPKAKFNLDVKASAAIVPVAKTILHNQATDRVLLSSFSKKRRDATAKLLGRFVAKAAAPLEVIVSIIAVKLNQIWLAKFVLRNVVALQIPTKILGIKTTEAKTIQKLHKAGVEVHYWTINDPAQMHKLLVDDADGIVTDRSDLAVKILQKL